MGSFGLICQADEVLCYIVACCVSAEGAISQMWFYIELPVPVAVM